MIEGHQGLISPIPTRNHEADDSYGAYVLFIPSVLPFLVRWLRL